MTRFLRFCFDRPTFFLLAFLTCLGVFCVESCTAGVARFVNEPIPFSVVSRLSQNDLSLDAVLIRRHVGATVSTPYLLYIVPTGSEDIEDGLLVFLADKVRSVEVSWTATRTIRVEGEARFFHQDTLASVRGRDGPISLQIEYFGEFQRP